MNPPDWNQIQQCCIEQASSMPCGSVLLNTNQGQLVFSINQHGCRLTTLEQFESRTVDHAIVINLPATYAISIEDKNDFLRLCYKDHTIELYKAPLSFKWYQAKNCVMQTPNDGHFVRQYRIPPLAKTEQGWLLSFDLGPQEAIYGLGEKWSGLNKRGQYVRSYNHDALGVNAEISYKNTPFAWSPAGWGVFVNTPAPVSHAVGFAPWSSRAYIVLIEDDIFDLFMLMGNGGQDLIGAYTDLTGKAPVPPIFSLGLILSKAYYKDPQELLNTAKAVRQHNMPCDTITIDGRAWQNTDTRFAFEWDTTRYKDPQGVINQLKALKFTICIWEYPLVSVNNKLFEFMRTKGWLIKDSRTGDAFRYQWDTSAFADVLTPLPESGIVDFTHPQAYQFWLESHKPLFDMGIDMIKADFGEQVDSEYMLAYSGENGKRLHNVYSLLYNRCVYEAASAYCESGAFLFSRSAWAGSQRYPSQWGGDPQADWGGLIGSIRGALSWGMSGAPYYASDVGGFYKDTRDPILFVRWLQAAIFSAHMRLHGIGQREPWSYGEQAEKAANKAIALRYCLIPYIYNCMKIASLSGLPVMRAMPIAFPEDKIAHQFDLQFMLGESILFAPCLHPNNQLEVYLPAGEWLRFPTKQAYTGGQLLKFTLALDEMAIFVKQGHNIALGKAVKSTSEYQDDDLVLQSLPQWPTVDYSA